MGKVRILNHTGDELLVTGEEITAEESGGRKVSVEEATAIVKEHVDNGGLVYVRKDGGKNEQVKSFDPLAQETVLAPRMAGG